MEEEKVLNEETVTEEAPAAKEATVTEETPVTEEPAESMDDYKDTLFKLFITTDSRGKEICRIIESDNNKKFPTDKTCLYPYNMQYKNIYQLRG